MGKNLGLVEQFGLCSIIAIGDNNLMQAYYRMQKIKSIIHIVDCYYNGEITMNEAMKSIAEV